MKLTADLPLGGDHERRPLLITSPMISARRERPEGVADAAQDHGGEQRQQE